MFTHGDQSGLFHHRAIYGSLRVTVNLFKPALVSFKRQNIYNDNCIALSYFSSMWLSVAGATPRLCPWLHSLLSGGIHLRFEHKALPLDSFLLPLPLSAAPESSLNVRVTLPSASLASSKSCRWNQRPSMVTSCLNPANTTTPFFI